MISSFPLKFNNKKLLSRAFIHRSYLNEQSNKKLKSNERLEFLGDAVLELIVTLYLFNKYPDSPEGKLTTLRSKLVQTKTLSLAANRLNLGQRIKMSRGENKSGGQKNPSILADTFEAVIGAIYKDKGFKTAFDFVQINLLEPAEKLFADKIPQDYKSKLQETVQAHSLSSPVYQVVKSYGPDHNKTFVVEVFLDGHHVGTGVGKKKKDAEQAAAKNALDNLSVNKN